MDQHHAASSQGSSPLASWYRATRIKYLCVYVSSNWIVLLTSLVACYLGGAFAAPILMSLGMHAWGSMFYRLYWLLCHQFAHRSWFLFGPEPFYPAVRFQELTSIDPFSPVDLWAAKYFQGNQFLGWKVALCQRDVAIYVGILVASLTYAILRSRSVRVVSTPWIIYLIVGLAPIGLDGFTQILSQPPYMLESLPLRESTPLVRSFTGLLFGVMNVWLAYPYIDSWMAEVTNQMGNRVRTNDPDTDCHQQIRKPT